MITRENYEIFFIDYYDNQLSDEQKSELIVFLEQNPDLQDEFYEFAHVFDNQLEPEKEFTFSSKESLYIDEEFEKESISEFDKLCIAYYEKDISKSEKEKLQKIIDRDERLNRKFKSYQRSFLKPDLEIVYPNKGELKRNTVPLFSKQALSIAASIIILALTIFAINKMQLGEDEILVAENSYLPKESTAIETKSKKPDKDTLRITTVKKKSALLNKTDDVKLKKNNSENIVEDKESKSTSKSSKKDKSKELKEKEFKPHKIDLKGIKKLPSGVVMAKKLDEKRRNELVASIFMPNNPYPNQDKALPKSNYKDLRFSTYLLSKFNGKEPEARLIEVLASKFNKSKNYKVDYKEKENGQKAKVTFKSKNFSFSTNLTASR